MERSRYLRVRRGMRRSAEQGIWEENEKGCRAVKERVGSEEMEGKAARRDVKNGKEQKNWPEGKG